MIRRSTPNKVLGFPHSVCVRWKWQGHHSASVTACKKLVLCLTHLFQSLLCASPSFRLLFFCYCCAIIRFASQWAPSSRAGILSRVLWLRVDAGRKFEKRTTCPIHGDMAECSEQNKHQRSRVDDIITSPWFGDEIHNM